MFLEEGLGDAEVLEDYLVVALQEVEGVSHRDRREYFAGGVVAVCRIIFISGAFLDDLAVLGDEPAHARAGEPVLVEAADDRRARIDVGE